MEGNLKSLPGNKSFTRCRSDCSRPGLRSPTTPLVLLNGFRTGQGHCAANHHTWGLTDNPLCSCGQLQTMSNIVDVLPFDKFPGGLPCWWRCYWVVGRSLHTLRRRPQRQETIDRLDSTSGPTSSHLAEPCSGGCRCHSAVNSMESWEWWGAWDHRAAQRSVRTWLWRR